MASNPNVLGNSADESAHSEWDGLAEMPAFEAQDKSEQNETGIEVQGESEQKMNPEAFKDAEKLREQLEKMGAPENVVKNPAFQRELNSIITVYGLKMSEAVDGGMDGDKLVLSGEGKQGDAREHDRSQFSFEVGKDGKVKIESAYADYDNDRKYGVNHFGKFEGDNLTDGDGLVSCIELNSGAAVTEFGMSEDGSRLVMTEKNTSAMQITPYVARNKQVGVYSSATSETMRQFDDNGVEQYREDKVYGASALDGVNNMRLFGMSADGGQIQRASTAIIDMAQRLDPKIERSSMCKRNDDGTMKARVYDAKKGTVTIEKCEINTEYGDDELIPENGAIAAAFEEAQQ